MCGLCEGGAGMMGLSRRNFLAAAAALGAGALLGGCSAGEKDAVPAARGRAVASADAPADAADESDEEVGTVGELLMTVTCGDAVVTYELNDSPAAGALLAQLRHFIELGEHVDLVITNYVYEHVEDDTRNVVDYRRVLPVGKVFTWNDMGHFMMWQYLLMHALTYRVDVLREAGLDMPPHTFYVDNIYAYVPFPACRSIYYLDVDVYRYFIGREDQSVNDKVLTSRVDHYWRVARVMMHAYHVYDDISSAKLRSYMMNYFTIIMAICSVFSKKSDRPDAMDELQRLWDELRAYDHRMYRRARHGVVGLATNLPGTVGRALTLAGYRAAQKLVKFN